MADRMHQWISAMRAGHYSEAWALRAITLAERDPADRDDPNLPYHQRWVWDGSPVDDRHVLVRCYQGLGDTIQFLRFVPLLARRAASVMLEIQPTLIDLAGQIGEGITIQPFDQAYPLPPREIDLEIAELDFVLRARPGDSPMPYLTAHPAQLRTGMIGLCYSSGDWDVDRSIPISLMAPLCRLAPAVTLVPGPCSLDVLNPEGCPFDMNVTAAIIAGIDLVVTVDTMIAHLAGAMGKPTWLLLKAEPDWRWAPSSRHSPWYPSVRLYAQPTSGDWNTPLAEVARDLAARAISIAEA